MPAEMSADAADVSLPGHESHARAGTLFLSGGA